MKVLLKHEPELYKETEPINEPNLLDISTAQAMHAYLELNGGIGLSSAQIGYNRNIVVVRYKDTHLSLFDPRDVWYSPETDIKNEGCLSFPGEVYKVRRSKKIILGFTNAKNQRIVKMFSGYVARIIQHELDHNRGITLDMRAKEIECVENS